MPNTYKADGDDPIVDGDDPIVDTEHQDVDTEQKDVDIEPSNNAGKEVSTNEEKEKKILEEKEKSYQGQIDNAYRAVIIGEKSLEEVLRDTPIGEEGKKLIAEKVHKRQEEIKNGKSLPPEDEIVNKVKVEFQLDELLTGLEEEQKINVRNDFKLFIENGKTTDEAFESIKKLHDLKNDEEIEKEWSSVGTRFRRTSQISKKASMGITAEQKAFAEKCGNDPKEVYKD